MDISEYIQSGSKVFLSGIGGVSMSALASLLLRRGCVVSGSDRADSEALAGLRGAGACVHLGHTAANIDGCDCVIRTAAIRDDNAEITAAHMAGIPVFERADAWGAIMDEHKAALCISGTHGKTTTTAMCIAIARAAGADVTAMLGGTISGEDDSNTVGNGDLIIAEACEYFNSFLRFRPTVAAILNIEADHLDFFSGLDDIIRSFREFASIAARKGGAVIFNNDDPNCRTAVEGVGCTAVSFSIEGDADVRATAMTCDRGRYSVDIAHSGGLIPVSLKVPGLHNVSNALAAAACMLRLGFGGADIARGLSGFTGAKRRFEYLGSYRGADFYDDYAHHPTEMRHLFTTAKNMGYDRVLAIFQPHLYSRTRLLMDDFADALCMVDEACVLPIFAAREDPDGETTSEKLAAAAGADCAAGFEEAQAWLEKKLRPGDLVLTVGAGEAYEVAKRVAAGADA